MHNIRYFDKYLLKLLKHLYILDIKEDILNISYDTGYLNVCILIFEHGKVKSNADS